MRDALSIFDQVAASSMNEITYQSTIENLNVLDSAYYNRLLETFLSGNVPDALLIYKEIRDKGFNNHFFLAGLGDYFRDLVVARDPKTIELLETDDSHRKHMAELAAKCTPRMLYKAMELCNMADMNYRTAANKQFLVELTLIKLCQADSPSPNDGSDGEGQKLKPIAAGPGVSAAQVAPAPAPNPASVAASAPAPVAPPRPQPAVSQAPRPAPHAPKASASGRVELGPRISIRPSSVVNAGRPAAAEDARPNETAAETATRETAFSDDDLALAWADCASLRPAEVALNNILRSYLPRRAGGTRFVVGVCSEAQHNILSANLYDLLARLRDVLKNDRITIDIELVDGGNSPAVWTENQVLDQMLRDSSPLQALADYFRLNIS